MDNSRQKEAVQMEKEKSIRISSTTYKIIKEEAKKRMQSIKTIVTLSVEQFLKNKKK